MLGEFFGDSRSNGNSGGGFFSSVGSVLEDTAKEILPVWAAKELNVQRDDQMANETFNQDFAQPTMANYPSTTDNAGQVRKTGMLFDNINISATGLIGIAVAVVAGVAIAKF